MKDLDKSSTFTGGGAMEISATSFCRAIIGGLGSCKSGNMQEPEKDDVGCSTDDVGDESKTVEVAFK